LTLSALTPTHPPARATQQVCCPAVCMSAVRVLTARLHIKKLHPFTRPKRTAHSVRVRGTCRRMRHARSTASHFCLLRLRRCVSVSGQRRLVLRLLLRSGEWLTRQSAAAQACVAV
jgi:hypothetical protein